MNVGIYIYKNAEVLDFSGPFEVFSTASRFQKTLDIIQPLLIAERKRPVMARGNYSVNPHWAIDDHPPLDIVIAVGGIHEATVDNPRVIQWITKIAPQCQVVASVCTGAFILAEAGLLDNRKVTTHWEDIADLRRLYPLVNVLENCRWVEDGKVITSAGISAGIDMSLFILEKIYGRELAEQTARQMEYDWNNEGLILTNAD